MSNRLKLAFDNAAKAWVFPDRRRSYAQDVSLFLGVEGRCRKAGLGISIDCVLASPAYEKAAMRFDVTEEVGSLHPS